MTTNGLRGIRPDDFVDGAFQQDRNEAKSVISLADVYSSIRAAPASSVLEISIFSHAYLGGPILVDSNDQSNIKAAPGELADKHGLSLVGQRDPSDKDGRSLKDFNPDMGDKPGPGPKTNLQIFAERFDTKGTFRVWGCNMGHHENSLIAQMRRNSLFKRLLGGGPSPADTDKIDFEWVSTFAENTGLRQRPVL